MLEQTTVDVLRANGLGQRMDAQGHAHDGMRIVWAGRDSFYIDCFKHLGKRFMAYGQTQIQEDLFAAADQRQARVLTEATGVQPMDVTGDKPYVLFRHNGEDLRLDCDYIAGCDGFHGVSRKTIPATHRREFEKAYPFGWLGILSRTAPLPDVTYANHPRGFALASMRSSTLSRYYVQVPLDDQVEDWSDDRFWSELTARFPADLAAPHRRPARPSKSPSHRCAASWPSPCAMAACSCAGTPPTSCRPRAPRAEPGRVGRVLPGRALAAHYREGSDALIDGYSAMALRRVWSFSVRTSWYLTNLLHRFPGASDFDQRAQEHRAGRICSPLPRAQAALGRAVRRHPV